MVRSGARKDWGLGLAEVLTAMMILSLIGGTVGAIYVASMRTYARGITENLAQQKASWAVQRMASDLRLGTHAEPGDPPYQSNYVAISLPTRPFDSTEGRPLNQITIAPTPYLEVGAKVVYYRGDADGNLSNTGDHLFRRLLEADGVTLIREDVLADHVVDNPPDEFGTPIPIFAYWPDEERTRSVAATVTVEERQGARKAQATMDGEFRMRNFQ